eukprot:XP_001702201.1 sensory protein [Chlamydomonas reinhardtii]
MAHSQHSDDDDQSSASGAVSQEASTSGHRARFARNLGGGQDNNDEGKAAGATVVGGPLPLHHARALYTLHELLEQRKTLEEAVFSAMYTLSKGKGAESWKLAAVKVVLEGLVPFLVAFNPTMRWPIHTSNPVWQVVRWALPSSPIARIWGYQTYVTLMYVLAALIYTVAAAVAALTLAMRKQEHSKWLNRSAALLQRFTDVMFGMLVACFTGSHMITLVVAGVTAAVFFFMTALMLVAGCDLSPVAHGLMASPAAVLRLRVLLLKAAYVGAADLLGEWRKTQCGLAMFPGDVGLLILNANFLMEVKRDGPAARTQLQLALKGSPSLIQRYQIFSSAETSKRLKEGAEGHGGGGGLDLHSYVEFKRNYRAVVYRRVLERYPSNGKLLRCYGKFLEDVRNDPVAASRAYTEAARNGGADGLLSLDLKIEGSDKPDFLTSMDLHEDACMVINHEGNIMMVNSCVTPLLGYLRSELEGASVSLIMPQPFAGRHAGYMQRYVQGGEPHILDSVRDVVALHRDRVVFPLQLCVTKLSGIGTDSIFLGVMRPAPLDPHNVRAWVAPNGLVLCTDPQFASLTGLTSEEMLASDMAPYLATHYCLVSAALHSDRRLVLTCSLDGTVVAADDSAVFGFTGGSVAPAGVPGWRRDLLCGVVELDEALVVRRADMDTGLIVGLPPASLGRMPLHRCAAARGDSKPVRAGAFMRRALTGEEEGLLAGVPAMGPERHEERAPAAQQSDAGDGKGGSSRQQPSSRPSDDSAFGLGGLLLLPPSGKGCSTEAAVAAAGDDDAAATAALKAAGVRVGGSERAAEDRDDDEDGEDEESGKEDAAEEGLALHKKAQSQSEFVAQWGLGNADPLQRQHSGGSASAGEPDAASVVASSERRQLQAEAEGTAEDAAEEALLEGVPVEGMDDLEAEPQDDEEPDALAQAQGAVQQQLLLYNSGTAAVTAKLVLISPLAVTTAAPEVQGVWPDAANPGAEPPYVLCPEDSQPTPEDTARLWNLSDDQQQAFMLYAQLLLTEAAGVRQPPVCSVLTGKAGSGKSRVLQALLWFAYQHRCESLIALVSYTWRAALHTVYLGSQLVPKRMGTQQLTHLWTEPVVNYQAALVQLAAVAYQAWLVWRAERGRTGPRLVGLALPAPVLRALARRPLLVLEAPPLCLKQVLLLAFGVLSFKLLDGLELPLASLTMAGHVIYRNTRVRMAALLLVAGHDAEERARWRSVLATEVAALENEYDTLMYGGVASSQAGGVFQHAVPASTFESGTFSANFFKTNRCFRWDPSTCYTPDSPYYELTHHGLDPMMRRVIAEVQLLIADDDEDVSYAGSRYTTLYRVGVKDLYEGLVSSAQLSSSLTMS